MYTVLRISAYRKSSKEYTKPLLAQSPNDKSNKSPEGINAGTESPQVSTKYLQPPKNQLKVNTSYPGEGRAGVHFADDDWKLRLGLK